MDNDLQGDRGRAGKSIKMSENAKNKGARVERARREKGTNTFKVVS